MSYDFYIFPFSIDVDWDGAFELVGDGIQKIRKEIGVDSSDGFRAFLNLRLQNPKLQVSLDHLFLLTVGACRIGIFEEKMKEVLEPLSGEFSLYLHNFRNMKRNRQDLIAILEHIAIHAGRSFWWILFRINRHSEVLRIYKTQEVSLAILKTLREIPEVLLQYQESTTRVVDYLVRWNDIDDVYANLRPIFEQGVNYQELLDPLLLQYLLLHKTTVDDFKKIINSKFLKNIFQCFLIPTAMKQTNERFGVLPKMNSSNVPAIFNSGAKVHAGEAVPTMSTRINVDKPANLNNPQPNGVAILFNETIRKIFNQKLTDVARLASSTPDYLLPIVVPIVVSVVNEKLKIPSNFGWDDYRYFAQQAEDSFENFPQPKQEIEDMVLKMTVVLVKSGSFQDVASLKQILLGLAERKGSIPFLKRPNIDDLRAAMSSLPRKFLQNLHSVVKKLGINVEKLLKPYRNGCTRSVVVQLENHFDQLDEILRKIQSRKLPLMELASFHVSSSFVLFYQLLLITNFFTVTFQC